MSAKTLTPDTATPGDGATLNMWSDRQAHTITAVSPSGKTITLQRDRATRTNQDTDQFSPGGFVGHTHSPEGQKYSYSPDLTGRVFQARWSEKFQSFRASSQTVTAGRHEHFDHNF